MVRSTTLHFSRPNKSTNHKKNNQTGPPTPHPNSQPPRLRPNRGLRGGRRDGLERARGGDLRARGEPAARGVSGGAEAAAARVHRRQARRRRPRHPRRLLLRPARRRRRPLIPPLRLLGRGPVRGVLDPRRAGGLARGESREAYQLVGFFFFLSLVCLFVCLFVCFGIVPTTTR